MEKREYDTQTSSTMANQKNHKTGFLLAYCISFYILMGDTRITSKNYLTVKLRILYDR